MDDYVDLGFEEIKVGEFESEYAKSGITSFFIEKENITGFAQRGGAPATMNTESLHLLHRENTSIDGIIITGRSIFGFTPANAIIRKMYEQGKGIKIRFMNVPIVPVAAIFDFVDNNFLPDESWGLEAFENKRSKIHIGNHGAGKGATVGKVLGIEHSMKSGQGYYFIKDEKLRIGVYVVVNAFGDIYKNDKIIAGAQVNGEFLNTENYIEKSKGFSGINNNTTIVVIFTNAKLDKELACKLSERINLSIFGKIRPYNTDFDGDTVFTVSFKEIDEPFERLSILAQKALYKAIDSIFI